MSLFVLASFGAAAACAEPEPEDAAPIGRSSSALTNQVKDACSFAYTQAPALNLPAYPSVATSGFSGQSRPVLVADVNGDGKGDLVEVTGGSAVTTFLGAGNGTFGTGIVSTVPLDSGQTRIGLQQVTAGDFDGDGKDDVVLLSTTAPTTQTNFWTGRFIVMFGGTNAALDARSQSFTIGAGDGTVWHFSGDFDGDGKDDLFFGNFGSHRIMYGAGTRTLAAAVNAWPNANGSSKSTMFAVTPSSGKSSLVIVTAGPTAKITYDAARVATVAQQSQTPSMGTGLVGGDLDGDGAIDFAGASSTTLNVTTLGSTLAMSKFVTSAPMTARAMVDLDGDDKQELIYADATGKWFAACGYEPGGTELAARPIGVTQGTGTATIYSTRDVNADGRPDFFIRTSTGDFTLFLSGPKPTAPAPLVVLSTTVPTPDAGAPTTSDGGKKDAGSSKKDAGKAGNSSGEDETPTPEDEETTTGEETTTTPNNGGFVKPESGCSMPSAPPTGGALPFALIAGSSLLVTRRRRRR